MNKFGGLMSQTTVIAAAIALTACTPDSGGDGNAAAQILQGAEVFSDNCAVCHGNNGRGPALSKIQALTSAERADRMRNHPQAGRIGERLTAIQLLQLVGFLKSTSPGEAQASGPEAQTFLEECGTCHGPGGRGPAFAELSKVPADQLEDRLRNHPVAGVVPQKLSASELASLIAFLESD